MICCVPNLRNLVNQKFLKILPSIFKLWIILLSYDTIAGTTPRQFFGTLMVFLDAPINRLYYVQYRYDVYSCFVHHVGAISVDEPECGLFNTLDHSITILIKNIYFKLANLRFSPLLGSILQLSCSAKWR